MGIRRDQVKHYAHPYSETQPLSVAESRKVRESIRTGGAVTNEYTPRMVEEVRKVRERMAKLKEREKFFADLNVPFCLTLTVENGLRIGFHLRAGRSFTFGQVHISLFQEGTPSGVEAPPQYWERSFASGKALYKSPLSSEVLLGTVYDLKKQSFLRVTSHSYSLLSVVEESIMKMFFPHYPEEYLLRTRIAGCVKWVWRAEESFDIDGRPFRAACADWVFSPEEDGVIQFRVQFIEDTNTCDSETRTIIHFLPFRYDH